MPGSFVLIGRALRYDGDADLGVAEIYRVMGYARTASKKARLVRLVDEIRSSVVRVARPRFVMEVGVVDSFSELQGKSPQLRRYAEKASHLALMVGTAGEEVFEAAQRFSERGDTFCQYLVGCAATALARRTLKTASSRLGRLFPESQVGPPLSPGNAGTRLDLQSLLARRLPIASVGVVFDAENMMLSPIASVSAVFGMGSFGAYEAEDCSRCASAECSLRAFAFQPSKLEALPWSA